MTLRFTLCTWHSTLIHTLHFTLHTLQFTLHAQHSALCIPHSTLYTLHFTLGALHSTLYTLCTWHSTLYTLHSTLHTPQSPLHTLHTTFAAQHLTVFTLHTLHSTPFHTPQSTLVQSQGKHVQNGWNNLFQNSVLRECIRVRWLLLFFWFSWLCGYVIIVIAVAMNSGWWSHTAFWILNVVCRTASPTPGHGKAKVCWRCS